MAKAKTSGSGWHKQSVRHSNARRFGKAGGTYSDMTYKGLQRAGIHLSRRGDADKDGVLNYKDCRPLNKKEQGIVHKIDKHLDKAEDHAVPKQKTKILEARHDLRKVKNKKGLKSWVKKHKDIIGLVSSGTAFGSGLLVAISLTLGLPFLAGLGLLGAGVSSIPLGLAWREELRS
jgi:hypothetical protein